MGTEDDVREMLESADASNISEATRLPDGSGFMTASLPLPKDHWLYQSDTDYGSAGAPPMPLRMLAGPARERFADKIRAAARYAVRASTMCGRDDDFDPDALVQNMVTGLIGYHTESGLSADSWANPDPVPPCFDPEPEE